MTYQELAEQIAQLTPEQQQENVYIFCFSNGELECLNDLKVRGESPHIDSHCSDFDDDNLYPNDCPYLLCGLTGHSFE